MDASQHAMVQLFLLTRLTFVVLLLHAPILNLIITVKDTTLPPFLPSLLFGAYEFHSQIHVLQSTTAEGFNNQYYTIFELEVFLVCTGTRSCSLAHACAICHGMAACFFLKMMKEARQTALHSWAFRGGLAAQTEHAHPSSFLTHRRDIYKFESPVRNVPVNKKD